MYHQRDMEEAQKDPEVVLPVNPRDWPKTLETMEEYIRLFCGVDGQPLRYGLMDDLIDPVAANDPTYRNNGIEYFTHDEEMIARGSILSGPEVLGADPEDQCITSGTWRNPKRTPKWYFPSIQGERSYKD